MAVCHSNDGWWGRAAKGLAKCLLVAWQWRFMVNAVDFCLPTPSMLDISQLLDEGAYLNNSVAWMLAYVHALQHVGEATQGQRWWPCRMHFSIQVLLLVAHSFWRLEQN